jgi:hypothetical protein
LPESLENALLASGAGSQMPLDSPCELSDEVSIFSVLRGHFCAQFRLGTKLVARS